MVNLYASKQNKDYIVTPHNNNEIFYKMDISELDNKKLYTVHNKDNEPVGTNLIQESDLPNSYGRFEKESLKIEFKRNEERITIYINNGETTIVGYGGFSNNSLYSYPWYNFIPLIFKEGNSLIATMDYVGNKKNITSKSNDIPIEIIISKKNKNYLPLFFEVYVLTQKYISSIK